MRWWIVWSAATALCLVLMLFHQSDNGIVLGRYSTSYMVQLGVMSTALIASITILVFVARGKLPNLHAYLPQGHR